MSSLKNGKSFTQAILVFVELSALGAFEILFRSLVLKNQLDYWKSVFIVAIESFLYLVPFYHADKCVDGGYRLDLISVTKYLQYFPCVFLLLAKFEDKSLPDSRFAIVETLFNIMSLVSFLIYIKSARLRNGMIATRTGASNKGDIGDWWSLPPRAAAVLIAVLVWATPFGEDDILLKLFASGMFMQILVFQLDLDSKDWFGIVLFRGLHLALQLHAKDNMNAYMLVAAAVCCRFGYSTGSFAYAQYPKLIDGILTAFVVHCTCEFLSMIW